MLERLQKIIARAGIASRRHAEALIRSGQVRVNGAVVTELGTKADPERDRIEAAGKVVRAAVEKVSIVLHKPPQVVATMADPEGRRTLRNCLRGAPAGVFPVGRLEYAASGLVLLTTDGELANELLQATGRLQQTYWIKVKGRLSEEELRELGRESGARLRMLPSPKSAGGKVANAWYEATLGDARRDVLRKKLGRSGHPVEKMKRVKIGSLSIEDLPEGRWRALEEKEVAALRRAVMGRTKELKPPMNADQRR